VRFVSAEDTLAVFDWGSAIDCVVAAYRAQIEDSSAPGRLLAIAEGRSMRCMPAITPGGRYMGTKHLVKARGGQITFLIALFDQNDGSLAFLLDAVHITALRTAATTVAALRLLEGPPTLRLAVLGSSMEARTHVEALHAQFEISSLSVYSPNPVNRAAFGERCAQELGIAVNVAQSAQEAVAGASHVLTAARSRGEVPILYADWLAPQAIVLSIGSTLPSQRELDISVIERAAIIVADEPHELARETGDMIEAARAEIAFAPKLHSLQSLARGQLIEHLHPAPDLILFKSIGSGRQDIAVAELIAERCGAAGIGQPLPVALVTKEEAQ
jgi:alanine dehydrogenase